MQCTMLNEQIDLRLRHRPAAGCESARPRPSTPIYESDAPSFATLEAVLPRKRKNPQEEKVSRHGDETGVASIGPI